jgi:hypothetical protein
LFYKQNDSKLFFFYPNIFGVRLKLKRETKIFSSGQSGRKAEIFRD